MEGLIKSYKRNFNNVILEYGIFVGSNKILLIKPGQDGDLFGYNNKYYNLGKYINEKYGFTIFYTNNPFDGKTDHLSDAINVINEYKKEINFEKVEIYFLGLSNGGVIGARFSYKYSEIKRLLLINPPLFINLVKMINGLEKFNGEKIDFIFGSLDPSYKFVGVLDTLNTNKVNYHVIKDEDHNLSLNTYSLEYLVEKYLLVDEVNYD